MKIRQITTRPGLYWVLPAAWLYGSPRTQRNFWITFFIFLRYIDDSKYFVFITQNASSSSEVYSSRQVRIEDSRFWWMDNMLISIFILLFITTVALVFAAKRPGRVRKKKKEVAKLVRDRTTHMSQIVQKLEKEIAARREVEKQLQESNATKERLMKVISHDMRSPFQGIIGFASMLRDEYHDYSDEERKEMIDQIIHSTQRAISLLNNMLEWTRLQSGHMTFNPERQSPAQIADSAITLLRNLADSKKISVRCDIDPALTVHADANMLHSIFQNLLSNAIKFTGNGGSISVTARRNMDMIEFQVTDDGVGMKKEILDKILNRETGISTPGTANERGSGIGLQLCKELIAYHGGSFDGTSSYGKGTEFRFTIPAGE